MAKTLISVFGYSQNIVPGNNSWEEVTGDRLDSAVELTNFFKKHGIDADLYISGGTISKDGTVEADAINNLLHKKYSNLEKIIDEVILDKGSKNTQENIKHMVEYTKSSGADSIFGVSSGDHVARIVTEFQYSLYRPSLVGVVPSKGFYSINGSNGIQPLILEPPFFGSENPKELRSMYTNLFKLNPYQKVEIGQEIVRRVEGKQ